MDSFETLMAHAMRAQAESQRRAAAAYDAAGKPQLAKDYRALANNSAGTANAWARLAAMEGTP